MPFIRHLISFSLETRRNLIAFEHIQIQNAFTQWRVGACNLIQQNQMHRIIHCVCLLNVCDFNGILNAKNAHSISHWDEDSLTHSLCVALSLFSPFSSSLRIYYLRIFHIVHCIPKHIHRTNRTSIFSNEFEEWKIWDEDIFRWKLRNQINASS